MEKTITTISIQADFRCSIWGHLESDVFADIDYIPFHEAEGYFKEVGVGETPGSRDIVLYNALPNSLPRVGGIITSVIQTPLSHVNLRAIQDIVPNAYIKDPMSIDSNQPIKQLSTTRQKWNLPDSIGHPTRGQRLVR